jgi:tetratricopeptide (TPR) repeat protein
MAKDTKKKLLRHLKSRLCGIIQRGEISIQGDGNVIGDNNTVTVIKQRWTQVSPFLLSISIVILLGLITVLFFQYRQFRKPSQMEGEFNVAVAEISVVDPDGNPVRSDDGKAVARFLAQRLETYFEEIDKKTIRYEIWSPDNTGRIAGKNPEERVRAAESLAQRIDAHILVYGVVIYQGGHSKFTPEFFVNYKGFELAQEVIGSHQLGTSMIVPNPFDVTQLQAAENPALAARIKALSLMTIGLAYYSIDDFEEALDYFGRAIETEGWADTAGKEVVYLLQGNTYFRLASNEMATNYVQFAENSYSKALSINPAYTRAMLGLSGVIYLRSVGDPNDPSFETVDLDGLVEAEQILLEILATNGLPESMNYEAKINYSLGRIYLVRAQVLGEDWLEKSYVKTMEVVQEYERGNQQIVNLAGHAYAQAGLIELLKGDNDKAINHYTEAVELVTPYYQAHYYSILGEIYNSMDKIEFAIESYKRAIQIAEFYGDEKGIHEYTQRLSELKKRGENEFPY